MNTEMNDSRFYSKKKYLAAVRLMMVFYRLTMHHLLTEYKNMGVTEQDAVVAFCEQRIEFGTYKTLFTLMQRMDAEFKGK